MSGKRTVDMYLQRTIEFLNEIGIPTFWLKGRQASLSTV